MSRQNNVITTITYDYCYLWSVDTWETNITALLLIVNTLPGLGRCYLRDEPLVLAQPGLPHGGLAVETSGKHLQLLLANQLVPQRQLPLVLRLLQALPRLQSQSEHSKSEVSLKPGVLFMILDGCRVNWCLSKLYSRHAFKQEVTAPSYKASVSPEGVFIRKQTEPQTEANGTNMEGPKNLFCRNFLPLD